MRYIRQSAYGSADILLMVCAYVKQDLRIVSSPIENSTLYDEVFVLDYNYYIAAMIYTKNFIVIMFNWFFVNLPYK